MRRILLLCLLCPIAHAQSGRRIEAPPDLRPLSVTQLITVEEYAGGRVVKAREFKYELYFLDDGRPATTAPVISAFRLRRAYVRHFDRVVKADPRADFRYLYEDDEPGLVLLRALAVSDPTTGLPDHKVGGASFLDKNGRSVVLLLNVRYRNWRKRRVEVRVLDDEPER